MSDFKDELAKERQVHSSTIAEVQSQHEALQQRNSDLEMQMEVLKQKQSDAVSVAGAQKDLSLELDAQTSARVQAMKENEAKLQSLV
jgi:hypothetical protein